MKISGEIQPAQIADLLYWVEKQHKTGRLLLTTDATEQCIYFSQGFIAGVEMASSIELSDEDKIRTVLRATLSEKTGQFEFLEMPLPPDIAQNHLKLAIRAFLTELGDDLENTPTEAIPQTTGQSVRRQASATATSTAPQPDLRSIILDRLWTGKFKTPLLPTVATKVLEITRRDNYSLHELSQVILTDQVIAAHVLKHANSPLYGGNRQIDNLPMAFQRIGSEAVTKLVFALSLQGVKSEQDIFLAKKSVLWKHSAACALFARLIALPIRLDHNLAFLCGLMQDFGKIILLSLIQESYQQAANARRLNEEMVEKILAVYHPMVGSVVGQKWNLPIQVVTAMSHHHTLTASGEPGQYAAIANLSNLCATLLTTPPASQDVAEDEVEVVMDDSVREYLLVTELADSDANKILGLSFDQLAAIVARAPECLQSAQDLVMS